MYVAMKPEYIERGNLIGSLAKHQKRQNFPSKNSALYGISQC